MKITFDHYVFAFSLLSLDSSFQCGRPTCASNVSNCNLKPFVLLTIKLSFSLLDTPFSSMCGKNEANMPYGELGYATASHIVQFHDTVIFSHVIFKNSHVAKSNCCCCVGFSSSFGENYTLDYRLFRCYRWSTESNVRHPI